MSKKMTQKRRIKQLLEERKGTPQKGVTSMEAFRQFGITRLSSIIHILRHKEDMDIKSEQQAWMNRYGEKVYFALYYLEKK